MIFKTYNVEKINNGMLKINTSHYWVFSMKLRKNIDLRV